MSRIENLHAREILDARGLPTVEVDVLLDDGTSASAAVPSGAPAGGAARQLRDGDPRWYAGLGVSRAVAHVNGEIARAVRGRDPVGQKLLDRTLIELDGTPTLSRLGANAILGVSLAACRAAAETQARPVFDWIGELAGIAEPELPMPMVGIVPGGRTGAGQYPGRGTDVGELLAVPVGAVSFAQALHHAARVRSAAADLLAERGRPAALADGGGPNSGFAHDEALDLMAAAIRRTGLEPGTEVAIAADVAGCSFGDDGPGRRPRLRADLAYTAEPAGWAEIALDRNGTLSGTLEVLAAARAAGFAPVLTAGPGETEDAFLADLAVGAAVGHVRIGPLRGSDRLSTYNRLLRIADSGVDAFARGARRADARAAVA